MTAAAAGAGTSEIRCCAVAAGEASKGLEAVTEDLRCLGPHPRHRPSNWHAFEAAPQGCFAPGRKAETSGAEQGQAWSQSQPLLFFCSDFSTNDVICTDVTIYFALWKLDLTGKKSVFNFLSSKNEIF